MPFTASLWDRTSTINGADPAAVLGGYPGIPDDSPIVLVHDGEQITQVQPTDPSQPGWAWWADEDAATAWADGVVDGLNNPPPPPDPGEVPEPPVVPEPEVPVTRAEFDELIASFDWLANYVITGEA